MKEIILKEIRAAYPKEAAEICRSVEERLSSLEEPRFQDSFTSLLQTTLYPLLACIEALRDSGRSEAESVSFARKIWENRS